MPRGQRKRGAYDCKIWFADGSSYRITSKAGVVFTNAEIAETIRRNVLVPLEHVIAAPTAEAGGLDASATAIRSFADNAVPRAKTSSSATRTP